MLIDRPDLQFESSFAGTEHSDEAYYGGKQEKKND